MSKKLNGEVPQLLRKMFQYKNSGLGRFKSPAHHSQMVKGTVRATPRKRTVQASRVSYRFGNSAEAITVTKDDTKLKQK